MHTNWVLDLEVWYLDPYQWNPSPAFDRPIFVQNQDAVVEEDDNWAGMPDESRARIVLFQVVRNPFRLYVELISFGFVGQRRDNAWDIGGM